MLNEESGLLRAIYADVHNNLYDDPDQDETYYPSLYPDESEDTYNEPMDIATEWSWDLTVQPEDGWDY